MNVCERLLKKCSFSLNTFTLVTFRLQNRLSLIVIGLSCSQILITFHITMKYLENLAVLTILLPFLSNLPANHPSPLLPHLLRYCSWLCPPCWAMTKMSKERRWQPGSGFMACHRPAGVTKHTPRRRAGGGRKGCPRQRWQRFLLMEIKSNDRWKGSFGGERSDAGNEGICLKGGDRMAGHLFFWPAVWRPLSA